MKALTGKKLCVGAILFIVLSLTIFQLCGKQIRAATNSFGISPPSIRNTLLIPGSKFEQEIVISRATPTDDAVATISLDGDLSKWIVFQPTVVTLPKGAQRVTVKAIVTVPNDTKDGEYKGIALVKLQNSNTSGQVILAPAIAIDINLKVGNTKTAILKVLTANIPDTKRSEPLMLQLKVSNEGNLAGSLSKVQVTLFDLNHKEITHYQTTEIPTVEPFSTSTQYIKVPAGLPVGQYFADIEVYSNNTLLLKNSLPFTIIEDTGAPANTVMPTNTEDRSKLLNGMYTIIILLIGGIFIAIIIILLLVRSSKKNSDKKIT